jgi:hypothetical protein
MILTSRPIYLGLQQVVEVEEQADPQALFEAFVSRYFNKPISVMRGEIAAIDEHERAQDDQSPCWA